MDQQDAGGCRRDLVVGMGGMSAAVANKLGTILAAQRTANLAYAERYTGDRETAEDAVQEAHLKTLMRFRSEPSALPPDNKIPAYLQRVLTNVLNDLHRQTRRGRDRTSKYHLWETQRQEAVLRSSKDWQMVRWILSVAGRRLPRQQRHVVELFYRAKYDYEMIADVLGITVENVRVTHSRAIQRLREELEHFWPEDDPPGGGVALSQLRKWLEVHIRTGDSGGTTTTSVDSLLRLYGDLCSVVGDFMLGPPPSPEAEDALSNIGGDDDGVADEKVTAPGAHKQRDDDEDGCGADGRTEHHLRGKRRSDGPSVDRDLLMVRVTVVDGSTRTEALERLMAFVRGTAQKAILRSKWRSDIDVEDVCCEVLSLLLDRDRIRIPDRGGEAWLRGVVRYSAARLLRRRFREHDNLDLREPYVDENGDANPNSNGQQGDELLEVLRLYGRLCQLDGSRMFDDDNDDAIFREKGGTGAGMDWRGKLAGACQVDDNNDWHGEVHPSSRCLHRAEGNGSTGSRAGEHASGRYGIDNDRRSDRLARNGHSDDDVILVALQTDHESMSGAICHAGSVSKKEGARMNRSSANKSVRWTTSDDSYSSDRNARKGKVRTGKDAWTRKTRPSF